MTPAAPSLRRRLVAAVVGITAGVVLIAAIGLWLALRATLVQAIDRELHNRAERAARMDPSRPPPGWWRRSDVRDGERPEHAAPQRFVRIADADGKELFRSPDLPEGTVIRGGDGPHDAVLGDGRRVRALAFTLEKPDAGGRPVGAWIAIDREPTDRELARLAWTLAGVWAAATLLAWLAALAFRATVLRPLRAVGAAIDAIGPDDLSARVAPAAGPRELHGVIERVNGLLDRLQCAFRREQETIANLAHELRTPVAALRTALEFRRLAARDEGERTTLASCLRTVDRMQAVVGDLLLLARLESGREPLLRERADLVRLLAECVDAWEPRAAARGQRITVTAPEALALDTSPGHLRLALDNLLGNAIAHGDADGGIALALEPVAAGAVIRVENPFTGDLDAAALGAGFYRGDAARSGDHAGLGLALVGRLARLLGGTLTVHAADGRFVATISLP